MSGGLLFLVMVQVFLMGAVAALAIRYGYLHWKSKNQPAQAAQPQSTNDYLSPMVKQQMGQAYQARFQAALNGSAAQLERDLSVTAGHINNLVMRLATEIVSGELEHYRQQLTQLHKTAAANLGGVSAEIDKHKAEIEAKISQELEAEKQRLVKQIDTKIGDAVSSFLVETLQHNVDLGAQGSYLISTLEEHKAELIKEVAGDTQPSK